MMQLIKCVFKTIKYSKNKSIKNIIDRLKIYVHILVITTKGYGVLATKMECQNAFKPTECINCET